MARAFSTVLQKKPREVWCGHVNFSAVSWMLSLLGYKYSVLTYGIEVWHLNFLQKMFLRRAEAIISISRYSRDRILEQCPWLGGKVTLLPPKVDEDVFTMSRPRDDWAMRLGVPGRKIILTIARMDERERYKGYDRLIKILPEVIKAVPETHYVLAGGDGGDVERIQTAVRKAGLEDKVSILTDVPQSELPDLYRSAQVFVMPSTGEGFGIVFLEAIACGKPAIGGNKDGSRDPLGDGKLGILVDPEDENAIVGAIVKCLTGNLPEHLRNAEIVRERMLQIFGKEAFKRRLESFIRNSRLAEPLNRM